MKPRRKYIVVITHLKLFKIKIYHEVLHRDGSVRYNMLFDMINDKNQYFNIVENPENKYIVEMYSKN